MIEGMMKVAVTLGSTAGMLSVIACFWAGMVIMNDINDMYNDVMAGMGQFKVSFY